MSEPEALFLFPHPEDIRAKEIKSNIEVVFLNTFHFLPIISYHSPISSIRFSKAIFLILRINSNPLNFLFFAPDFCPDFIGFKEFVFADQAECNDSNDHDYNKLIHKPPCTVLLRQYAIFG